MPPDTRDEVVDFVRTWSDKTGVPACRFLLWLDLSAGKFHNWKQRFGQVNEHNAWVPRDHWLTPDEKERICAYARGNPLEGYRRLTTLSTLAQALRKGRNVGAHFDESKETDQEIATLMIEFLGYFLEYIYVLPGEIQQLHNRL